jgi:hypothetical protein
MSEAFVNQITIDCLLNKTLLTNHLKNQMSKKYNTDERKFYSKRITHLFKEMLILNGSKDLSPDVTYAFDNFINVTINYFKTIDQNDLIQNELNDSNDLKNISLENLKDDTFDNTNCTKNADEFLMRSIKINDFTLDKYVTKTRIKKKEEIIMPKQKEFNLKDPNLKIKGIKKNNITNIYEDKNPKKEEDKTL